MALEYCDTATPVTEAVGDSKAAEKQDLSRGAWDSMKSDAPAAKANPTDSQKNADKNVLDLQNDSMYKSVHDVDASAAANKMPGASPKDATSDAKSDTDAAKATEAATFKATVLPSKDIPINKDIEPSTYEVKPGDTLSQIAREKLGKDATQAEILQYVKETAKLNNIKNPDLIHVGDSLNLPGHTKDGGLVTVDKDGNKSTEWKDGHYRVDNKDKTGFEVTPDTKGGFGEKHWGPAVKDNYERTVDKDSNQTIKYPNGDVVKSDFNGNETRTNHDGTGYERKVDADGKITEEKHTGPSPENNYVLKPQVDGSLQGKDAADNKHYKWNDGKEKVEYKDGRGYTKTPDADGGYSEHHWGPRPGDNFEKTVTPDGKVEVREKPADAKHESIEDADINAQREKLKESADKHITDPKERAKFDADMARFEERSKEMEETYKKQGMSPEDAQKKAHEQIAKTYEQVGRILDAPDNPKVPIDSNHRREIAEQVMSQAADPKSVDQGIHPTCNVATVESRTYSRNPQEASKLVADMVTTGEYTTKDGTKVTLDQESLQPHDGAKTNPPTDGQRSYASQLFQVTTVNIGYAERGSTIHYEQHEKDPTDRSDDGARQVDWSKEPHEELKHGRMAKALGAKDSDYHTPGLNDEEILKAGNRINNETDKTWYVAHSDYGDGDVNKVKSEKEFEDQIKDAKEHGKLPMVVKVHTGNEPFYTDSGAGAAGGSGGWHVVTIRDYQEGPPAKLKIDNQWGTDVDHTGNGSEISVHDLYHTMRDPKDSGQMKELQKDVDYNSKEGQVDHYKELELLRLKHSNGDLNDKEYKEELAKAVKSTQDDWDKQKRDGTLHEDAEYYKTRSKIQAMVNNLPADQQMEMLHLEQSIGYNKTPEINDNKLTNAMINIVENKKKLEANKKYDSDQKEHYEKAVQEFQKIMNELPEDRRNAIMDAVRDATTERRAA